MHDNHLSALCLLPVAAISVSAYAVDYLSIEQAQQILFPNATSFSDRTVQLSKQQKSAIRKLAGVRQRWSEQAVWRADGDDGFAGWVIVDNVIGKHEYITYAAGLSPHGQVIGVEILSYRETHGGEIRAQAWRDNFKGKTLEAAVADLPVDLSALASSRAAFAHSGAYRGETAVARHGRFSEQLDTSSHVALARSVLLLHEKVSEERRRAPWVWEDQGVLFSDIDVERPSDAALHVGLAWRNDYYLEPLHGIVKQLAEVRR